MNSSLRPCEFERGHFRRPPASQFVGLIQVCLGSDQIPAPRTEARHESEVVEPASSQPPGYAQSVEFSLRGHPQEILQRLPSLLVATLAAEQIGEFQVCFEKGPYQIVALGQPKLLLEEAFCSLEIPYVADKDVGEPSNGADFVERLSACPAVRRGFTHRGHSFVDSTRPDQCGCELGIRNPLQLLDSSFLETLDGGSAILLDGADIESLRIEIPEPSLAERDPSSY